MTSPKLQQIERMLGRASKPAAPSGNTSNLFMEAMEDSVARIAADKIALAEAMQKRAEGDSAELRKELSALNKEMAKVQREMQSKMDDMNSMHKSMMDNMRSSHSVEMKRVQQSMDGLRTELAEAQKCMAGMEAKHEAAERMYANAEKMVETMKVATPAPIVQNVAPAAAPMKPFTMSFHRDGGGRIVSSTIVPST